MAKFKVFLILTVLPYVLSQCTKRGAQPLLARATYDFNYDLISRIAEVKENHFVTSTLSIWELITTVALGAEGETLQQMKSVLGLHYQPCFNKKYEDMLMDIVKEGSRNGALVTSPAIFVDDSFVVKEDFISKVKRTSVTEVFTPSFNDINETADLINAYVTEKTNNSISNIVTPEDLQNKYLILINAIYFKANWKIPFDTMNTALKSFNDEMGQPIGETDMLFRTGDFNTAKLGNIHGNVLELPYEGPYSMLIFLPDKGTRLSDLIESMKAISLKTVFKSLKSSKLSVQLPKFSIESDLDNLSELLKDMGLTSMFSSTSASFPYISDYNIYVSDLIQKAGVVVTEEGTVAAAVTEVNFADRSAPATFYVNRPFLFMIIDKSRDLVLFSGAYSKPGSE